MGGGHDRASGSLDPASAVVETGGFAGSDVLSDVLRTVRLTGALFFHVDASSPWVVAVPPSAAFAPVLMPAAQLVISYHVVISGAGFAAVAGQPPVRLDSGDVVVFPHGDEYVMSSAPGLRAEPDVTFFRLAAAGAVPARVSEGGGGPERMQVLCGFLGCDVRPFNPLLATLPPLLHLRRPSDAAGDRLSHLIEFAMAESAQPREGGQCVLLRLSELMFVLTQWRMQVAARLLADGTAKVSAVAIEVGYDSEAAFSRAFKRLVGVPPSAWRRKSS